MEAPLDVAPGLWIWRQPHPDWKPGLDWEEAVTSTCVETGGEVAVLDALAPPDGSEAWARLDARPPTLALVLKHEDDLRTAESKVSALLSAR